MTLDPVTLKSLRMMARGKSVASIPRPMLKELVRDYDALSAKLYEAESREIWLRDQLHRLRRFVKV